MILDQEPIAGGPPSNACQRVVNRFGTVEVSPLSPALSPACPDDLSPVRVVTPADRGAVGAKARMMGRHLEYSGSTFMHNRGLAVAPDDREAR